MADEEECSPCHFGVRGCQEVGDAERLNRLCGKHCLELLAHLAPPAGASAWTEDLAVLHVYRAKRGVPIDEDGGTIINWAARADAQAAREAGHHCAELLFNEASFDATDTTKHPELKTERPAAERLFANGYIWAMCAAVVSFCFVKKRKPKGAEFLPWLHHAWSRYISGADGGAAEEAGEDASLTRST